jgi:hypothetical protein
VGRWWAAVFALLIGVGAGFAIARVTESGSPKRTVDVTHVFVNPKPGEAASWTTAAVRRACAPSDVALVNVTIINSDYSTGRGVVDGATYTERPKSFRCTDFMRQFEK